MKKLLIAGMCLIAQHSLFAQFSGDTSKFITESGDVLTLDEESLSDDKMLLKDQYDAVRKGIVTARDQITEMERYKKMLTAYQLQLQTVAVSDITDDLDKIVIKPLTPAERDDQASLEQNIFGELYKLEFQGDYDYGGFNSSGRYYDDDFYAEYMMKMFASPITNELERSPIISQFMRFTQFSSSDEIFFETQKSVDKFKIALTAVSTRLKQLIDAGIGKELGAVDLRISTLNKQVNTYEKIAQLAKTKFNKKEEEINLLAIKLGLPLFCGTILALFILPLLLRKAGKKKNGESDECSENNNGFQGIILETCTVLLVTATILILGLAGKLSNEVLGTLIGGISGYVLNRMRDKKKDGDDNKSGNGNNNGPETNKPTPVPEVISVDENENLITIEKI